MCEKCMMYDVYTLPDSICTTQNTKHKTQNTNTIHPPLPSPPLPGRKKKAISMYIYPKRPFRFIHTYLYLYLTYPRKKSVASVSIIRFFAWQEEEGELQKKKREWKGSRQAGFIKVQVQ